MNSLRRLSLTWKRSCMSKAQFCTTASKTSSKLLSSDGAAAAGKNQSDLEGNENCSAYKLESYRSSSVQHSDKSGQFKTNIQHGPPLQFFMSQANSEQQVDHVNSTDIHADPVSYIPRSAYSGTGRTVFIETYGCQMNYSDTEIAWSILLENGFTKALGVTQADVVLLMTCSVREGAETKIWKRLQYLKHLKQVRRQNRTEVPMKIGILGCMAERLKHEILERERAVDLICGPDAYRDLPKMLAVTSAGQAAVNVLLSLDETYADISPVHINKDSKTAFVSVMRGCDNMCSYCVVPFTRGRERSRPISSILEEVKWLSDQGLKEVTLLGQNVNSYRDTSTTTHYNQPVKTDATNMSSGFKTVYKAKIGGVRFSHLLEQASEVNPEMRIRFTSPHPKDFPDEFTENDAALRGFCIQQPNMVEVLHIIKERANVCGHIHLPAQSGSTSVLNSMKRGYTREAYLDLVNHIRNIIPDVCLTSDFIAGFCGETDADHEDTLSLLKLVQYNFAYCFPYSMRKADVVLLMTCSVREGAETKIWKRLQYLKHLKQVRRQNRTEVPMKIGILGCMAERLKHEILERERAVDLICGPDAYRDLPKMLAVTSAGQAAVNVLLSLDETYADISPVHINKDSKTAFVSVMRGCDNMCSYCVVPFTRGRERSRPISSILEEVKWLSDQGLKEVTLLGQNVNSYRDTSTTTHYNQPVKTDATNMSSGFKTVYKAKIGGVRFSHLLEQASEVNPEMRIRFTSPHPKDFPDEFTENDAALRGFCIQQPNMVEVLHIIKERANVCGHIHLPAQSGSTSVLNSMKRGYTREAYLDLVNHIRNIIPDVCLTSDFIAGFCGETDADHEDTLSLLKLVQYNFAYCFPYSMRKKTHAYHRLSDNVPAEVKIRRHMELIKAFRTLAEKQSFAQIGQHHLILVEGESRRSSKNLFGRTDGNTKVIIPRVDIADCHSSRRTRCISPGDYVVAQIQSASSQVMKGIPLYHSTLQGFRPGKHSVLFEDEDMYCQPEFTI